MSRVAAGWIRWTNLCFAWIFCEISDANFPFGNPAHAFHRRSQGFSAAFILRSSSSVRTGSDRRATSDVYKCVGANAPASKLPSALAGTAFIVGCRAFGVPHSRSNPASRWDYAAAVAGNAHSSPAGCPDAFRRTQSADTRPQPVPRAAHGAERMEFLASNRHAVAYGRPASFSYSHTRAIT
jgi:hypothetical protein